MGNAGTARAGRHPQPLVECSPWFFFEESRDKRHSPWQRRLSQEQGKEAESRLCFSGWRHIPDPECFPSHGAGLCGITWAGSSGGKAIPHGEPLLQHPLPQNPAAAGLLMEEAATLQQLLIHVGKLLLATFGWEREEKEQHR